jgi:uncharacterized protein
VDHALPPRLADLPARELGNGLVVLEATSPLVRLRGLARLDALPPQTGLHFGRCRAIHTFGMRFALDLIWLDRHGDPVRVDAHVPPRRHRSARGARSVLEVGAGHAGAFLDALAATR